MKLTTSVLLLIFYEQLVNCQNVCFPDYYWRDYQGTTIPPDAIEGGKDVNGTPFYVAQAYFRHNELLPATVFPGNPRAKASAYNKVLETDKNVKILCSLYKENFKWKAVESQNLQLLTDVHVVVGGSEVGEVLYIGRVLDDAKLVLGKVFKHSLGNRGIWVPSGNHESNYKSYEVLIYNCTDPLIDIRLKSY